MWSTLAYSFPNKMDRCQTWMAMPLRAIKSCAESTLPVLVPTTSKRCSRELHLSLQRFVAEDSVEEGLELAKDQSEQPLPSQYHYPISPPAVYVRYVSPKSIFCNVVLGREIKARKTGLGVDALVFQRINWITTRPSCLLWLFRVLSKSIGLSRFSQEGL